VTVPAQRRARWTRQLGEACFALGDLATATEHVQASLAQLGRAQPSSWSGWAASVASGVAKQLWSRTLGRRPRRPDPLAAEASLAAARMASLHFFNDDSLGLIGSALAAANLAERAGDLVPIAEIYSQLGYIAGISRLPSVAMSYFARARDIAATTRDPMGMNRAYATEAAFHVGIGAWDAARAAATRGLEIANDMRNPQEVEVAYTILGHVEFATDDYAASLRSAIALYTGDLDAAIREFDRAMRMLEGQSDHASHVLCGGMLASALARAGELSRARIVADATTERITTKRTPVFTISEGFIGTADAYLELLRRGDASAAQPARTALAALARLAKLFPIAGPAASTLRGIYFQRTGKPRRAQRLLRRGLALAEQLHMPYDQAVAHAALGNAAEARALFERLGCRWHLTSAC
jgi:tetratricopeptide (TPR) repeat protein